MKRAAMIQSGRQGRPIPPSGYVFAVQWDRLEAATQEEGYLASTFPFDQTAFDQTAAGCSRAASTCSAIQP